MPKHATTQPPVAPRAEAVASSAATPKRFFAFKMEGQIVAVEPIHVSTADKLAKEVVGLSMIPRIVAGSKVDFAAVRGEAVKGAYRRCASEVAIDVLGMRGNGTGADMPFDMKQYYRTALGGVKGKGDQSPEDVLLIRQTVERNPIAYLFGIAEPYWMTGQVHFGHATCRDPGTWGPLSGGARRDDLLNDPELLASFSEKDQEGWLSYASTNREASQEKGGIKVLKREMAGLMKEEKTQRVRDRLAAIQTEIAAIQAGVDQMKGGEFVKESINRPLPGKNVIYPGAVLIHSMDAARVTPAQLGFFLKMMERMSDDPRIGGHASTGYGRFKANYTLTVQVTDNKVRGERLQVGQVSLDHFKFDLPDHPLIEEAIRAFDEMAADHKVDFLFVERAERSRRDRKSVDDGDDVPLAAE